MVCTILGWSGVQSGLNWEWAGMVCTILGWFRMLCTFLGLSGMVFRILVWPGIVCTILGCTILGWSEIKVL